MANKSPKSATQYMLLATFLFSLMGMGVKILKDIPFLQVVFFRAIISFVICLYYFWSHKLSPLGNNKTFLLLRGVFGTAALMVYFYTLQALPFATAVTLQLMSPLFAVFLAGVFLRESSSGLKWLFLCLAFLGVAILKGFDPRVSLQEASMAVGGAFLSAVAYNIVRHISKSEKPIVIVFYFPLVTLFVVVPILSHIWIHPDSWQWLWLVFVGITTHLAQICMTKAYRLDDVSNIVHLNYVAIIFAAVIGYIVFNESLSTMSLVGIALVSVSSYLNSRYASVKKFNK